MDYAEIAFKIVNVILKAKPAQVVTLSAEIHNGYEMDNPLNEIPFLEELAMALRKKKAFPILDIASENLRKRSFSEIPDEILDMPLNYYQQWVSLSDFFIDLSWRANPYFYKQIPDRYYNRLKKAMEVLWEQIRVQQKQIVLIGFPTFALAKFYKVEYQLLQDAFFNSLNCDYHELKKNLFILDGDINNSENWELITEDRHLKFKFDENPGELFYGDFNKEGFLILPTGKWERRIDMTGLNGLYYAHYLYFENVVYKEVQLFIEHGKILSVDFLNRRPDNYMIQNLLQKDIQSCVLTIGMNSNLSNPIYYSLFDECISHNLTLKMYVDNKVIALSNLKPKLLDNKENDILREV